LIVNFIHIPAKEAAKQVVRSTIINVAQAKEKKNFI